MPADVIGSKPPLIIERIYESLTVDNERKEKGMQAAAILAVQDPLRQVIAERKPQFDVVGEKQGKVSYRSSGSQEREVDMADLKAQRDTLKEEAASLSQEVKFFVSKHFPPATTSLGNSSGTTFMHTTEHLTAPFEDDDFVRTIDGMKPPFSSRDSLDLSAFIGPKGFIAELRKVTAYDAQDEGRTGNRGEFKSYSTDAAVILDRMDAFAKKAVEFGAPLYAMHQAVLPEYNKQCAALADEIAGICEGALRRTGQEMDRFRFLRGRGGIDNAIVDRDTFGSLDGLLKILRSTNGTGRGSDYLSDDLASAYLQDAIAGATNVRNLRLREVRSDWDTLSKYLAGEEVEKPEGAAEKEPEGVPERTEAHRRNILKNLWVWARSKV